jgi:hypothetical protein
VSDAQATVPADIAIDPRYPATAFPSITSVRLSPGDTVELVNISRSGVLVEGRTRFVPGTRVAVIFEGGFAPANAKGKVVRCQVSSISSGTLRYQSGIQFEKKLDSLDPQKPPLHRDPQAAARAVPLPVAAGVAGAPGTPGAPPQSAGPRRLVNRW